MSCFKSAGRYRDNPGCQFSITDNDNFGLLNSNDKNPQKRNIVARWLWLGAGLIFLMVIIGGITRLTGSGLSMTDWNLIMGTFPPTTQAEWQEAFNQYRQFPEYQQINKGMSLDKFKSIFFWEYVHRLLGRVIGLVFFIPFVFFWVKDYFPRNFKRKMVFLFFLGALQGGMGWFMVKSGLAEVPYVSHYRLAAHLLLAFIIMGFCVWFALDLREERDSEPTIESSTLKKWALGILGIFALQIIWGAFTAGLDAGYMYNTFPMMNESWIPPIGESFLVSLVENPGVVQWTHRILGTILALMVFGLWLKSLLSESVSHFITFSSTLLGIVLLQYIIGILTVLYQVPIALGVLHQGMAMIFLVAWLISAHRLFKPALYASDTSE